MPPSQILISSCLFKRFNLLVPMEIFHHLSQNKFDGKGEIFVFEHTHPFLYFCISNKVHYEDVACGLCPLTLGNHVKEWCKTLSAAYIHSFEFFKEFHHAFDKYDLKFCLKNQ